MDDLLDPREEPAPAAAAEPPDESAAEPGPRSRWLILAFVALIIALVWLGPAGGGAVAYSFIAGDPYSCGGG